MATAAYTTWVRLGEPYTLARPLAQTQKSLRAYGLIVYDYPNEEHQKANTPEDHTPYSVTGWPGTNKKYVARAIDVMPRNGTAAAKKENADIARQMIRDRDAGYPGAMWIKYINWTDEKGNCQQVRWTDSANPLKHTVRSSSDVGHIHVSGRSDIDNDTHADGYDPLARSKGGYSVGDSQLIANAERGVTAIVANTDRIKFDNDWPNSGMPADGFPNPIKKIQSSIDELAVAGVSDERLVSAVKQALLDPEVARIFSELMFNAAQRAERE